jgi:hypothetical protein
MNAIRLIILVPSLFLLLGGATLQAKLPQNLREALATWKGIHVDKLITGWGPPTRQITLSNGNTVMVWETMERSFSSQTCDPVFSCLEVFVVDKKGIIQETFIKGCM